MGNPNTGLHFSRNYFKRAQAWHFHEARGTGATFSLPQQMPNSYTSLSFCAWYIIADIVLSYGINTSCINVIKSSYSAQMGSKTTRIKGLNEFLKAELKAGREEATDVFGQRKQTAEESRQQCSRGPIAKRAQFQSAEAGSSQRRTCREL